jgi:phthiocerol/phenolphthiocerol synthesis type-I polyketide synthase E
MPANLDRSMPATPTGAPGDAAIRLAAIWREVLGLDSVGPDDNYFDLGGDSSLAVALFARIEQEFGRKLSPVALFDAPTISSLTALLADRAPALAPRIVPLQAEGAWPPLFLLHDASGDVFGYRHLAQRLGPDQPVYGVRASGLDGEAEPAQSVEAMAAAYIPAIRSVAPTGPYYLAGYCGGGTIAYEVAQQLTRAGESVAFLGLLDTSNWSALPPATAWSRLRKQLERLSFHAQAFARLNASDRRRLWREKVKILRARVPVWRDRLRVPGSRTARAPLSAVWAANDRACAEYQARPYPGRITEFRPKWQYRQFRCPAANWEALAAAGTEVRSLPLYPATLLVEPYVAETAAALRQELARAHQAPFPECPSARIPR